MKTIGGGLGKKMCSLRIPQTAMRCRRRIETVQILPRPQLAFRSWSALIPAQKAATTCWDCMQAKLTKLTKLTKLIKRRTSLRAMAKRPACRTRLSCVMEMELGAM